jgi:uncharacterized protein
MIVDLRRLDEAAESRGRLTARQSVPYRDAFDNEIEVDTRVALTYERSGGAYFFHGRLEGEFTTHCHYCLTDVPFRVEGEFDVAVKRSGERAVEEDEGDESAGDLITLGLGEYEVSLDRHIVENLIVNIPMQIVCRDDCRGLCPHCGVDRNVETCDCGEPADPRWDALRKLKND